MSRSLLRAAFGGCLALAVAAGCAPEQAPPAPVGDYELLAPIDRLVRVSMALRGVRPAPEDVLRVRDDPDVLPALAREWLRSPEFLETLRDMHAELYLVRADTDDPFPAIGPLADLDMDDLHQAASDEPLQLVAEVVDQDRPYSEIVTADYVMADAVLARIYGLPYDEAVGGWQRTRYPDGRPHAGVLSTSQPYRRWVSNGNNFHRGRANFWSTTLLCESFADRDVVVEGGVDLSDDEAVARAVVENPTCVGCHQALDPMAAVFWGYRRQLTGRNVRLGEADDCRADVTGPYNEPEQDFTFFSDLCYPLRFYTPANEGLWEGVGLRGPAYFGAPIGDLADLGRQIAADPRFSSCSARQFYRWFGQIPLDAVAPAQAAALQETFEASGMRVRDYLEQVVLSDVFLAKRRLDPEAPPALPVQVTRPEQYARTIEALTGFRWRAVADPWPCADPCWGPVDLARSDLYGYRAMAGGVDGLTVTQPTHTVTPVKLLVVARFANEAAAHVVRSDLALPAEQRRLLTAVDPAARDYRAVRTAMAALALTVLSEPVGADDPALDPFWAVWLGAMEEHGDAEAAWIAVVAAMLQDPALLYY